MRSQTLECLAYGNTQAVNQRLALRGASVSQEIGPGAPSCVWCHGESVSQETGGSCLVDVALY